MEKNVPAFSEIVKSFKPAKKYTSSARINRLPASLSDVVFRWSLDCPGSRTEYPSGGSSPVYLYIHNGQF